MDNSPWCPFRDWNTPHTVCHLSLCLQLIDIQIEEILKIYVFLISFFVFSPENDWDTLNPLPSVLLVACHQSEVIIDAESQPGYDLLSTAVLSSQHLAICSKFIHSFTNRSPWCLIMLLPLNAYNNHWQFWRMWSFLHVSRFSLLFSIYNKLYFICSITCFKINHIFWLEVLLYALFTGTGEWKLNKETISFKGYRTSWENKQANHHYALYKGNKCCEDFSPILLLLSEIKYGT